jgi:hypothetical protein
MSPIRPRVLTAIGLVLLLPITAGALTIVESSRQNTAFLGLSEPGDFDSDHERFSTEDASETFGPQASVEGSSESGIFALGNASQTSSLEEDLFSLTGSFYARADVPDSVESGFGEGFGQSLVNVWLVPDVVTLVDVQAQLNAVGGGAARLEIFDFGAPGYVLQVVVEDGSQVVSESIVLQPGREYLFTASTHGYGQAQTGFNPGPSLGDYDAVINFSSSVAVSDAAITPATVGVGPNPARTGSPLTIATGTTAPAVVTIHDLAGRRVAGLPTDGSLEITWDARDRSGRPLTPGVYFVRVANATGEATRRVTIIR